MANKTAEKTAVKTVAEVQAEIAALATEQEQLRQDLNQIEQAIADNWNGDNGESEASYALKQARLNASGRVLERLQKDLAAATKVEKLEKYRQLCETHIPQMAKTRTARANVQQLEEQLKAAQEAYQETLRWDNLARHMLNLRIPAGSRPDPANEYEDAGITQSEISAIRAEVREKYKVVEE